MNSGSSLTKYAPFDVYVDWREVTHAEGLGYIATAMSSADPALITKLRLRVNLGATDAQTAFTHHIKAFFKALKTYPHLTHLDMGHCQITDQTCRDHLAPMLEENTSIEELMLDNNVFTDFGMEFIMNAFALGRSNVSSLDVNTNQITYECMESVARVVGDDRFTKIDLSHSRIGAEGVKILCPSLAGVTKLNSLLLENVQMGDEGCIELAKLIKGRGMQSVSTLNVCENHIGRIGVEKLVSNFVPGPEYNQTVTSLDVSKNYFGDEGFDSVLEMMRRNYTMKTLKVNRCGFSINKFTTFCEKLQVRYDQQFGPYPELEILEVGLNGLGNDFEALLSLIKHKNCRLKAVNYEGNEVSNFGAKKWAEFLKANNGYKETIADRDDIDQKEKNGTLLNYTKQDFEEIRLQNKQNRQNFTKLSLKSNAITEDGAEYLAGVISSNKIFNELDLRKNNIGVKGAIFFKKAFRKRQANIDNYGQTFLLHILPADVTDEGVNHLAIGMRESPAVMKKWISSKANSAAHQYVRPIGIARSWALALETETQKSSRNEALQELERSDTAEDRANIKRNYKAMAKELKGIDLERKNVIVEKHHRVHGSLVETRFKEFDTPAANSKNISKLSEYKRGVNIVGQNDEKEDVWAFVNLTTYRSLGIVENDRGMLKWHPFAWVLVKGGWGCIVSNTLYRFGLMIRYQYYCEEENYVEDLYLQRNGGFHNVSLIRKARNMTTQQMIDELVQEDIKNLWEQLMGQTCAASGGLTMFEFVLQYSASPVIDCVRQFINIFPAVSYAHKKSKYPAVFLQQTIAKTGLSYRDLCLACSDKFVKRYAEAKKLVLFRFLVVEPIYRSRFIKVSKVEDLLLTEEYDDSERFFYMRQIADTKQQEDEKLANNEFETHLSFMASDMNYLSNGDSLAQIDNFILPKVNLSLDVEFMPMVSQLYHQKQSLIDDRLVPSFTTCYKTDLKEVLDNQGLAGGRDLGRAQIIIRMLANSLDHFNCKKWVSTFKFKKDDTMYPDKSHAALINKARIHGNVKPRNIVLRVADELPDLDKGIDMMPGKWVLTDFSRSTAHGDIYLPMPHSAYNPPEVAKRIMSSEAHVKCKIEANEKMDVWQFGCVLYEMLSGTTLFKMEARDDTILDEEERGELANWLSLDEERSSLILNQLQNYNSQNFDEDELKKVIESGRQLCEMCLQGRPEDRPSFKDILNHPFLLEVNIGKLKAEKELDQTLWDAQKTGLVGSTATSWGNSKFLQDQPHLHLMNTDFEHAGVIVKSMQESLSKIGCRMTTDSLETVSSFGTYEETLRKNVQSARIVCCLLTRDVFLKPNVVKQILFAEDYRKKSEKPNGRILFLDLGSAINLKKDNLEWDKNSFRDNWTMSDEFQYLVKALAQENPSFSSFGLNNVAYDDQFDAWNKFLNDKVRGIILSYLQEPIKYQPQEFLNEPMLDRMLLDGNLIPVSKIKPYSAGGLSSVNFKDPDDLTNQKMAERKEKYLNLYFLPANRVRKGDARVYVLSGKSMTDETFLAVSQIAQALESPSGNNRVDDDNMHKDAVNPKNKLFNKVKTSYNIKKDSHLKTGSRVTMLQSAKDAILNVTRESGELVVVFVCTPGVFKRYAKFMQDAVKKRDQQELILVLVSAPGWNPTSPAAKQEIESFVPAELKDFFKNKDNYLPYFKPKKDPWQFDATMNHLVKVATYKLDHPSPKTRFSEVGA